MYSWKKLMGEMTIRAYCKNRGLNAPSCRFCTVYGNRSHEIHAVIGTSNAIAASASMHFQGLKKVITSLP